MNNKKRMIKIGDLICINGIMKCFASLDPCMNFEGTPCVFLADDLKNKNTYGRYTQQFLAEHGYKITNAV